MQHCIMKYQIMQTCIMEQHIIQAYYSGLAVWGERSLAHASARASTLQGELSATRLYCFRGAENFRNNMHYVNHHVFDEDMEVQFKTTNKYRILWPITRG